MAEGQGRLTGDKFPCSALEQPSSERFAAGKYKKPIPRRSERVVRVSGEPVETPRERSGEKGRLAVAATRRYREGR